MVKKNLTRTPTKEQSNINTNYTDEYYRDAVDAQGNKDKRGVQVYYVNQLVPVTGKDKEGNYLTTSIDQTRVYLSPLERNEIFRLCTPVLGVVSSRMMKMAGLPYHIVPVKDIEDEIAEELKTYKQLYEEFDNPLDFKDLYVRSDAVKNLSAHLPDIKPDLSNFDNALLRWKKRIRKQNNQSAEEIEYWLSEPNTGVSYSEYVKKWTYDIHIHGACATYKRFENGRLQNFDTLVGGTVAKVRYPYFKNISAFAQVIPGYEPQIFFGDEISYSVYMPLSIKSEPVIPLEALINKVAETLLFDSKMANEADGTVPPEKAVIVTETSKAFSMDSDSDSVEVPLDRAEQKRIEEKLNTPIEHGVITFSGNNATVVDLSRADTLSYRIERQKDIREEVALVYQMTNMEINLTGSGETGGRATSESQAEIESGKGIAPHVKLLEEKLTRDFLNVRYGYGWKVEIEKQKNEREERELDRLRLDNAEITVNELREEKGRPVFVGEEYDKPRGGGEAPQGGDPMGPGSQRNPLYNKIV